VLLVERVREHGRRVRPTVAGRMPTKRLCPTAFRESYVEHELSGRRRCGPAGASSAFGGTVCRRRWVVASTCLAPEDRDRVAEVGASWSAAARRPSCAARDVVVGLEMDAEGALVAAACSDGRVQIHDFDAFATKRMLSSPCRAEVRRQAGSEAADAAGLPEVCRGTEVLTIRSPAGAVGSGVAWDPSDQNCLWAWYDNSNSVHMYDLEKYDPARPRPDRMFAPPPPSSSSRGQGICSAQFASAGGSTICSSVFAAGGRDGIVRFYDKRFKPVPIYTIEQSNGALNSMQLSTDGQLLLFCTRGTSTANPAISGYDLRAVASAVGRDQPRAFLGERSSTRGCLLAQHVDASFRAPRPPRCSQGQIAWVPDATTGFRVATLQKLKTGWTYSGQSSDHGNQVAASSILISPTGDNVLAYQLEDGSVGQVDLLELQAADSSREGVVDSGGGGSGAYSRSATVHPSRTAFTFGPLPAQRGRFKPGFTASADGRGSCLFYYDSHPLFGDSISLHNFGRSTSRRRLQQQSECADDGGASDAASSAVWQAENPVAHMGLSGVLKPSSVAFHPSGDEVLVGGANNTVFVLADAVSQ
jgi:WD40 repeat protein